MRRTAEILFFLTWVFLRTGSAFFSPPATGGFPGEALSSFSVSPRALALGDAHSGVHEEAAAIYYNPAASSFTGYQSISVYYTPLPMDGRYASVFYNYPLFLGTSLGLGLMTLTSGEAQKRNEWGGAEGVFREEERAMYLNVSRRITDAVAGGINVKFINKQLGSYGDSAYGIDAGFSYSKPDSFTAGMRIQNILRPEIRLYSSPDRYPFNIRLGFSSLMLDRSLLGLFDFEIIDAFGEVQMRWHTGAEYIVLDVLRLRAGLSYKQLSAGVGIITDRFSYSYALRYSEMGLFHSAGIAVKFGHLPGAREIELDRRERLLLEKAAMFENWRNEQQRTFLRRLEQTQGLAFEELEEAEKKNRELEALIQAAIDINSGNYSRAESALRRILSRDPANPDANVLLGIIQDDLQKKFSFNRMMAAYESGNFLTAVKEARMADDKHPQYGQALIIGYLSAARHSVLEGNLQAAKSSLESLLRHKPDNQHAIALHQRVERLMEIQTDE